jgi:putative nucleotidyltransferase with HDIG domain
MVLIGGLIAHAGIGEGGAPSAIGLLGAALALGLLDALSLPLLLAPIAGEPPRQVLVAVARETAVPEAVQYAVGLVGADAALRHVWTLGLLIVPCALVYMACKNMAEMHDGTRQLLESMADTVDLRDPYTGGHSRRVTEYSAAILRELGLHGPEVALIVAAARVHDIGKIGTPDAVLNKPGKLTPEERAVMEEHPVTGATLLKRYQDFTRGVALVRHHHERWDGTGYPDRLKGTEIPFGARVIAVADSFDAMTSDRPYRAGMPVGKAAAILRAGRGQQWDAALVDALLRSASVRDLAAQRGESLPGVPLAADAAA